MLNWNQIKNPELDIVGIVAILGEASTLRNAQASALGWHHILPRLLPAPQALLKHEHERRLPTMPGTVVGAYSGNVQFELNFFCQLLHRDDLQKNEVQLVVVESRNKKEAKDTILEQFSTQIAREWQSTYTRASDSGGNNSHKRSLHVNSPSGSSHHAYSVNEYGPLALLSVLGCCMTIGMVIGSVLTRDGYALLATVLLSITSTVGGFASRWRLDLKQDPPKEGSREERHANIPDSDVVIFYPRQGAFRIVRCSEEISKLYFRTEGCEYVLGDNTYRVFALTASVLLMAGLLSIGNSETPMKIAFAFSYIVLNALCWGVSALNPVGHRAAGALYQATSRRDTRDSLRNTPVMSHYVEVFQDDRAITYSPTTFEGPSTMTLTANGEEASDVTSVNQRKRTFCDSINATNLPGGSVVILPEKPHSRRNTDSTQSATTDSTVESKTTSTIQRQGTKDIEGLKNRVIKPLASIQDKVTGLFAGSQHSTQKSHADSVKDHKKPDSFTTALWKAIAVTGSIRWLKKTHIAPDNEVWAMWIVEAGKKASSYINHEHKMVSACTVNSSGHIELPSWNHEDRLTELFHREADVRKRRPPKLRKLYDVVMVERFRRRKVKAISPSIESKLRRQARLARERVRSSREERGVGAVHDSVRQRHSLRLDDTVVVRDFSSEP